MESELYFSQFYKNDNNDKQLNCDISSQIKKLTYLTQI